MKKLLSIFFILLIPVLAYDSITDQLEVIDKTLSDTGNKIVALEQNLSNINTSLLKVDTFSIANKVWIVLACILFIVVDFIVTKIVLLSTIPEIINFLKNTDYKSNELPKGMRLIMAKEEDILKYSELVIPEKHKETVDSMQTIDVQLEDKPVETKPINKTGIIESIKNLFKKKEVKNG